MAGPVKIKTYRISLIMNIFIPEKRKWNMFFHHAERSTDGIMGG